MAQSPKLGPAETAATFESAQKGDLAPVQQLLRSGTRRDRAVAAAALHAAHLRYAGVTSALRSYLRTPDPDISREIRAWSLLANCAFAVGRYDAAAEAADRWIALLQQAHRDAELDDAEQLRGIARALQSAPRQFTIGAEPLAAETSRDKAGLRRTTVEINGKPQAAVLDTGANLSVVSSSTAKRLGLRVLSGTGSVGSSTRKSVPVTVAVADSLRIAGTRLANVAFLVVDDSQLSFPVPGGYQIDAIVGFPVFRDLGRVMFAADGRFWRFEKPVSEGRPNMVASGSDLFIAAKVNGVAVPLRLDSGASHSTLSSSFARAHPAFLKGATRTEQQLGGAGGATTSRVYRLTRAEVEVDQHRYALHGLTIAAPASGLSPGKDFGVVGQDLLRLFGSYAIDFRAMHFKVSPDLSAAPTRRARGDHDPEPKATAGRRYSAQEKERQ